MSADHPSTSGGPLAGITITFFVLGVLLLQLMLFSWLLLLEPRLSADAQSRAAALSQAQSHYLTKVLSQESVSQEAVIAAMDEILVLTDQQSGLPFLRSLALEVDYDSLNAPLGSLDLRFGDLQCDDCLRTKVFLQHEKSLAQIGIATFYASPHFLQDLLRGLRWQLFGSSLIASLLLLFAWLGVRHLLRRQQESEANLRNVFTATPIPLLLLEQGANTPRLTNSAARDYFANQWQPTGAWAELLAALPPNSAERPIREQQIALHPDHNCRWVLLSSIPLHYLGRPARLLAVVDITPLKNTQLALAEAKESAERATHAKGQFLATMSHEIRTPLNAIIGSVRLLVNESLAPVQQQRLHDIEQAGELLLSLVNDILDLTRVEAGRIELEQRDFTLQTLTSGVCSMLTSVATAKGVALFHEQQLSATAAYQGDPNRLRQVLLNLLGNAIKFTEQGEVRLTTRRLAHSEERDLLEFRVCDSGIGIAPEAMGMLFQEFSQLDQSIARRFGGSGLGLAISQRLVGLMGGEIRVESRLGEGSTFFFEIWLPHGQPPPEPIAQPATSPTTPASPSKTLPILDILVVDDVALNRAVLRGYLEHLGQRVEEADSGEAALNRLTERPYQLLLLDLRMPLMDGQATTRHIRNHPDSQISNIPIVMVTADVTPETRERCIEAGVNDLLPKPIPPGQLERIIAQYR